MKTQNRKSVLTYFFSPKITLLIVLLLYVSLLLLLFCQNKYIIRNKKVSVLPHINFGSISFRGAWIDDTWYDPQNVLISSDGWVLDEEENVLTAIDEKILELQLPIGMERTLVFNTGFDQGIVEILVSNKIVKFELNKEKFTETGGCFKLPYVRFSNKKKLNIATALLLLFLSITMILFCFTFQIIYKNEMYKKFKLSNCKNSSIEFLRFFIILCVVIHHYCALIPAGYLGVDFFFLLSGFFLMQHFDHKNVTCDSTPELSAAQYTFKRYLRLLPYYLFAFLLSMLLSVSLWSGAFTFDMVDNNIWELFMLEAFGFTENLAVGPGWYCSALLISGFLAYYFLSKCSKVYLYVLAPFSLCIIYSWMSQTFGTLNRWLQFDTFISTGTLRGFAEIGLGCILYKIYSKLKGKELGSIAFYTILEFFCFSYILYVLLNTEQTKKDFVCVFVMAILVLSLFLKKSLWTRILENKLSLLLGEISISIYLNHQILSGVNWYNLVSTWGISWNAALIFYLFIVIIFSLISNCFIQLYLRILKLNQNYCN